VALSIHVIDLQNRTSAFPICLGWITLRFSGKQHPKFGVSSH